MLYGPKVRLDCKLMQTANSVAKPNKSEYKQ